MLESKHLHLVFIYVILLHLWCYMRTAYSISVPSEPQPNYHTMRTIFFITSFSLTFILSSYCQDQVLLLTKKKNQKEKTVEEGRKIKVYANDGSVHHDRFHAISDSLIVLESDTVSLSEIEKIRTKSTASKVVGGIFAGSGGIVTIFGSMLLIEMVSEGGLTALHRSNWRAKSVRW